MVVGKGQLRKAISYGSAIHESAPVIQGIFHWAAPIQQWSRLFMKRVPIHERPLFTNCLEHIK